MLLTALAALSLAFQPADAPAEPTPLDQVLGALQAGQSSGPEFDAARDAVMAEARAGDPASMNMAGILVQNGLARSERTAEDWFRAAAGSNDAETVASATVNLALYLYQQPGRASEGRALLEGYEDGPQNITAMQQGYLGFDYLVGIGGDTNQELGRALINGAIVSGFENAYVFQSYAQFWLNPPDGVEPRPDRADELFRRAIQAGSVDAAWSLAMLILQRGGPETEAWRFVEWASDQNHPNAMISRAVMLATGQGVEQNEAEARDWYLRAAKAGQPHGLRGLGAMYVSGEGGDANPALGYALLDIAAAAGDPGVAALLDALEEDGHTRPSDAEVRRAREAFTANEGLGADSF